MLAGILFWGLGLTKRFRTSILDEAMTNTVDGDRQLTGVGNTVFLKMRVRARSFLRQNCL